MLGACIIIIIIVVLELVFDERRPPAKANYIL